MPAVSLDHHGLDHFVEFTDEILSSTSSNTSSTSPSVINEIMEADAPDRLPLLDNPTVINLDDYLDYLSNRPLTILKQTKFSRNRRSRHEYRHCRCGCRFRMIVRVNELDNLCTVRETEVPPDHQDVEENPENRVRDKEVHSIIDQLILQNKFTKNYGSVRIINELRSRGIPDCKIPSKKQLANKLFYIRRKKFEHTNEITPLEERLRQFVFTGDEADEQPFIYHYASDNNDRLILGDGSDR